MALFYNTIWANGVLCSTLANGSTETSCEISANVSVFSYREAEAKATFTWNTLTVTRSPQV